ncbi:MAG TPA: hypothetical protein VJZ49_03610 [Syntrophales bacterium]|nr:hypothetical protein [Syntrophales bacterium]
MFVCHQGGAACGSCGTYGACGTCGACGTRGACLTSGTRSAGITIISAAPGKGER